MKTKASLKLKIIFSVVFLLVLSASGALAYTFIPRPVVAKKGTSTATFAFDDSKAPGWFAGANIDGEATNADAAPTSIKLATTTRIFAQGTADKPTGNCFVQYSYWANSSKRVDQVLSELSASSDSSTPGTFTLEPTNTVSLSMETSSKDTPFQLHQYKITGPDTENMSTGQEIGVLKAGTGYIDIRGYCKTAEELSVTLPVLSAVSFKL